MIKSKKEEPGGDLVNHRRVLCIFGGRGEGKAWHFFALEQQRKTKVRADLG